MKQQSVGLRLGQLLLEIRRSTEMDWILRAGLLRVGVAAKSDGQTALGVQMHHRIG